MSKAGCFCRCCATALIIGVGGAAHLAIARNATAVSAPAVAFVCFSARCGVPPRGAFSNLVVGRIRAIADANQATSLFDGMRQRGHWSNLPADRALFWKHLQPVAIDAGGGAIFVTFTSQEEMHAVPLRVGDFVRYSPHRGKFEVPPSDKIAAAYWRVDGCVAILCRASDRKCVRRYVKGVYRTSDGVQLAARALVPLKHGVVIDTQTMIPEHAGDVN